MSDHEVVCKKLRQEEESSFDDLDDMLVGEIISRLPLKDLLSCLMVSKKIGLQSTDNWFKMLHLSRSKPMLLIEPVVEKFRETTPPEKQLGLLDFSRQGSKMMMIPRHFFPSQTFKVMATWNGLLCLKEENKKLDPVWILNPLTKEQELLPSSSSKKLYNSCFMSLGIDWRTKRHKVLRVYRQERGGKENKVEMLTVGDSSWREMKVGMGVEWYPVRVNYLRCTFFVQAIKKLENARRGWALYVLAMDSGHDWWTPVEFPKPFKSRPFVETVELDKNVVFIEHEKWSMTIWNLCGKRFGKLYIMQGNTYMTRFRWSERVFFETIGKVEEKKFLIYTTTWKGDWDRFMIFDPNDDGLRRYTDLPRPLGLPHHFNNFMFKPSFLSPVVPGWNAP